MKKRVSQVGKKSCPGRGKCVDLDLTGSPTASVLPTVQILDDVGKLSSQAPEEKCQMMKSNDDTKKNTHCVMIDCTADTPIVTSTTKPQKRVFELIDKNSGKVGRSKKMKKSEKNNVQTKHQKNSTSTKKGSIAWFFNKKKT